MSKLLIAAAAAAAFAVPASAQRDPAYDERRAEELARAIPPSAEIEAMAPALDRTLGALLRVDVGPLLDAADPYRRHGGYGRPGRTLGEIGGRGDPWFEERLRGSIYGATADIGRMMDAMRVATPALARSLAEVERGMAAAIDDYHRRRGPPPPREDWEDEAPYPDEGYADEPYPDEPYPDDE